MTVDVRKSAPQGTKRRGRGEVLHGMVDILPLTLGTLPFALLLGSVGVGAGLSPAEVALMSAVVFAGSSQFVAVGLWGTGAGGVVIVASVMLVNLRHLLLGAALAPYVHAYPMRRLAPALFLLTDEVWALAMRRGRGQALTLAYWFGLGSTMYLGWLAGTVAGCQIGARLGDTRAWGLDFAITAVFVCLLAGFWHGRRAALPWLASAGVAVAVYRLGAGGTWHILAGGLVGAAVGALQAGGAAPANGDSPR